MKTTTLLSCLLFSANAFASGLYVTNETLSAVQLGSSVDGSTLVNQGAPVVPGAYGTIEFAVGQFIFAQPESGSPVLSSAPSNLGVYTTTFDGAFTAFTEVEPPNFFLIGLGLGLTFGGIAFTFRLVRQVGRHSPEV